MSDAPEPLVNFRQVALYQDEATGVRFVLRQAADGSDDFALIRILDQATVARGTWAVVVRTMQQGVPP